MSNNTKGLDFHQTFKPERSCLTSLLASLTECSGKTIQEISKIAGIPTGASSGKVVPTICYLDYMGLIDEQISNKQYSLAYTKLGQTVVTEDPGLMEDLTLILLHCMLARKTSGAELWSYVFCDLAPKYHNKISKAIIDKELEMHFGKDVNLAPFNGAYTGLFEQIGVLSMTGAEYTVLTQPINPDFIYLYGLVLYKVWDDWANQFTDSEKESLRISDKEITDIQLEETGFRGPFGWSQKDEYHVLEALHDKGIVALNRQMSPITIRRISTEEEITDMLYSELC